MLLVVAGHVWGAPSGGYVGVDVFFVLSGLLITGLLLREHARTGRIDLREFSARRVRRLLPAAAARPGRDEPAQLAACSPASAPARC